MNQQPQHAQWNVEAGQTFRLVNLKFTAQVRAARHIVQCALGSTHRVGELDLPRFTADQIKLGYQGVCKEKHSSSACMATTGWLAATTSADSNEVAQAQGARRSRIGQQLASLNNGHFNQCCRLPAWQYHLATCAWQPARLAAHTQ